VDGNGDAHISYIDYENKDIKYIYQDGGVWQPAQVVADEIHPVLRYTSIAIDSSGYIHISYCVEYDLKYATNRPPAPDTPTGLYLSGVTGHGATINWTGVSNATGYKVYRSLDDSTWSHLGNTTHPTVSYADTTGGSNTKYYWTVKAYNASGESGYATSVADRTALHYGWNQVSAPFQTSGANASAVFGAWAGCAGCSYDWISSGNVDPDNSGTWLEAPGIYNGLGIYVWADNNATLLTGSGSAITPPLDVTLRPGWNLVSNPTETSMADIDTNWFVDGSTLIGAILNGVVGGDLYWWDGSGYDFYNVNGDDPAAEPWKSYFMLNMNSVSHTLTIQ
jgi:hypothetical protein